MSGWRKKQIMDKIEQAFPNPHRTDMTGMTMQQYAAIKLKVPDSGIDWLDEMILKSIKDDFAAKVLPQCCEVCGTKTTAAEEAYRVADAMMKAREI